MTSASDADVAIDAALAGAAAVRARFGSAVERFAKGGDDFAMIDRTADLILLSREAVAHGLEERFDRPERIREWSYEFDPSAHVTGGALLIDLPEVEATLGPA